MLIIKMSRRLTCRSSISHYFSKLAMINFGGINVMINSLTTSLSNNRAKIISTIIFLGTLTSSLATRFNNFEITGAISIMWNIRSRKMSEGFNAFNVFHWSTKSHTAFPFSLDLGFAVVLVTSACGYICVALFTSCCNLYTLLCRSFNNPLNLSNLWQK